MSCKQIRTNTDKEHSRPPNEPEARLTYKNTEGYADPTCFYALCNVMRDEKRRKQRERQNHSRQNSRFPNRTRDAPGKKRFNTQVIHYDERGENV